MAKQQKMWRPVRPKQLKQKLPDTLKTEVQLRANQLVESVLKPTHIKPPADNEQFNYLVDIYTKWHSNYFYFCAKYCSPGPNGHGSSAAPDNETCHARFPLPNPLPRGEGASESLREFYVNAIAPFFETKFARLAYIGNNRFGLSYMRHTGQWWEIYPDLSLDESLTAVMNEPHFQP